MNYQEYVGHSLLNNVKQLAHQVTGNRAINGETSIDWRETQLNNRIRKIGEHIDKGSIIDAIRESEKAISFGKEALAYFRQYQRIRFLIYLSIMWLGWIIMLFLKITETKRRCFRTSLLQFVNIGFASLLIIMLIRHAGKKFIFKLYSKIQINTIKF